MIGTTVLTTERLILRRFTMNDEDALYRLNANPDVMRFLSRTFPTRDETRDELQGYLEQYEREPAIGRFAACERGTNHFFGRFSLDRHSDSPLSVGYRLLPQYWGKGLATEGVLSLLEYGFSLPDIECIRAQTMAVNGGSRRVMEKSGMAYVRTFHEDFDDPLPGTELGEVEYTITREEWMATRT